MASPLHAHTFSRVLELYTTGQGSVGHYTVSKQKGALPGADVCPSG